MAPQLQQPGSRKRPRPPSQPQLHPQLEESHFVYTLFPGTATLEAHLVA